VMLEEFVPLLGAAAVGTGLVVGGGMWARRFRQQRSAQPTQTNTAPAIEKLEQSEEGYLWLDAQRRVRYANPAAQRLLGPMSPDWLGTPVQQLLPDLGTTQAEPNPKPQGTKTAGNHNRQQRSTIIHAAIVFADPTSDERNILIQLRGSRPGTPAKTTKAAQAEAHTSLHHRQSVLERLRDAAAIANTRQRRIAVVVIDLDQFQRINESLGHAVGDQVLDVMATRLATHAPEPHILGRLGSDEFVAILLDPPDEAACIKQVRTLQAALATPIQTSDQEVVVTASIGLSMSDGPVQSADSLLQQADIAVHRAKKAGRSQLVLHTDEFPSAAENELQTELALRTALLNQEVWLAYQPQVDMRTEQIIGCEALIRWDHPTLGQVPPDLFIPVAESSGLIATLGRWVLRTACFDARRMLKHTHPDFLMSVNVSAQQFLAGTIVDDVRTALADSGLPAHCLELEITESLLIHDHEQTSEALHTLRKMGVHIAIDDFGTGYSSLAYLLRYPVDKLKIDRSFIEHLSTSKHDATLTSAIIAMAHQLEMTVVAEGVEESDQGQFLSQHSCDIAQGYLYGRAVPAERFMQQIKEQEQQHSAQKPPTAQTANRI